MIIVLFHVLYLVGKFVYQNYRSNKRKAINDDAACTKEQFKISERDYKMRDSEAAYDFDETSLRFFPPAYVQRYVAVSDVLNSTKYQGKLRKVVDFGCAELDFLVYLKNTIGIEEILCVDIDRTLLESCKEKGAPLVSEYLHTRTTPLVIEICEGSVTQNDKKLEKMDAVICIELIEHLYPDTLAALPYNIFGYIKPKLVVITTPNADFNVLFPNFSGFRHPDHKFEWTRKQFQDWAENIVLRYPDYIVTFDGICKGPEGTEHLGCCTQMALFHRVSDKDIHNIGVDGLFKTVARHEYPFRVDNRSDEQKILDEATYYIRHLSFQDSEMEEEVPLKKLLEMLKSFHISVDTLQTILEEAGWTIESRNVGPVVLVPPLSTFSDLSAVEDPVWTIEYSETDEDDWNREPGPPTNSSRFLGEDSIEIWDSQNWEEEPSIFIPQNNSVFENNTYLFDEDNALLDHAAEATNDTDTPEKDTEIGSNENLTPIPSVNNLEVSILNPGSSCLNESVISVLSDTSYNKLGDTKDGLLFDTISCTQEDASTLNVAQTLNRTLDYPAFLSVSRASTSPEPFLVQAVKMDQHLGDDSMCNQSMSNAWMLNNSYDQTDISVSSKVSERNSSLLKNDADVSSNLHCIYLNTSYKEFESSDMEQLDDNTTTNLDQVKSVTENGISSMNSTQLLINELQLSSGISIASSALIDNQPQFTSSPKFEVKSNTVAKKRRSLDYKEQCVHYESADSSQKSEPVILSSNNFIATSSSTLLPNVNNVKVSNVSSVNLKAVEDCYDSESSSMQGSASTIVNDNKDKQCTDEFLQANPPNIAGSVKGEEKLPIPNLAEKANQTVVKNGNRTQSKSSDTETCIELVSDNHTRKTEVELGVYSSSNSKIVNRVNSVETTSCHAKDVNLRSASRLPNLNAEDSGNAQNVSVLTGDKQSECSSENVNRESKCKNTELAECTELKSSSPENVETPPKSWSPEVADSGYPNSASAQDITPECDLSSIAQDHLSDSESPSIAEAPRLGVLEAVEVENGDLVNNNRDGEGNNMRAAELNDMEDLQPLIDVLENDMENENDIYVLGNGFPIWLLRILNMANPMDVEIHMRDRQELRFPNDGPEDGARYMNVEHDEGFDGSSEENSDLESNEMGEDANDANENGLMNNENENDNENAFHSDSGSEQWVAENT